MARAVSGIASSRRGHLAVRRTRRAASSIVGETQAGQQDHCFLDSLYRAAVATHAAMRLRVFMQLGIAGPHLVEDDSKQA
jgi:hypothetical protein